ncbi:hypothetical protein H0I76_05000 [Limibaculum sp. M0105]|uniref:Uncharacterized protein n=1 Tax=Thermohalobaculum xanthum TaxID=2753746 RepID=A0A8J7SCZ7_9RHOB|nr:hypothetical protein [Thermohalobaculum xanthum]MBK0398536.1 hypothetical protein [Thermohalobaculum xanthum]
MSGHGGRRLGAGRKPGAVSQAKRFIAEMAREHSEEALAALIDVALHGKSEAARVSAANSILDRAYGRPKTMADPLNQPSSGIFAIDSSMSDKEATEAYLRLLEAI